MNRPDLPDEEEQYRTLTDIVRAMGGRPVTVRTLDVGGEKLATSLGEQIGESVNPALGLRAIRLSLREPQLLRPQLAAMLRAAVPDRKSTRLNSSHYSAPRTPPSAR